MPKLAQYQTVKAQVDSFKKLGFKTLFEIQSHSNQFAPKVVLSRHGRDYRFVDEDWNVVIMQLATLFGKL